MAGELWIRGGTVVTMDDGRRVLDADVRVVGGRIAELRPRGGTGGALHDVRGAGGTSAGAGSAGAGSAGAGHDAGGAGRDDGRADRGADVLDATGMAVIPGLVQTHIHLCQTLFRGQADDLELLDWLRRRIWPLEAAHDPESLRASALLGIAELIRGGTTCIVDMGTVRHQDEIFRALEESGLRAFAGKTMMDHGAEVPPGLMEETEASVRESVELCERWHGRAGGRLRYAFAPRFVVSCTDRLLTMVRDEADRRGVTVHTHASESCAECDLVLAERGRRNVTHLHHLALTGPRTILAHCIHLDDEEIDLLARTRTRVAHCPSSNLKLSSGIARVAELRERGVEVSIGADGAPCNNNLDGFHELRLAALLQKVLRGPTALPAGEAFELATRAGARAVGMEAELGSIEPGKVADLAVVDLGGAHLAPAGADLMSRLVYAARSTDVRHTVVGGRVLMRDRRLLGIDEAEVLREADRAIARLKRRAGL